MVGSLCCLRLSWDGESEGEGEVWRERERVGWKERKMHGTGPRGSVSEQSMGPCVRYAI